MRDATQEGLTVEAGIDHTYFSGIEPREFNPTGDLLDPSGAASAVDIRVLLAVPASDEAEP